MFAALHSTRKDIERRSIWKQAASYGRSSAFEATIEVRSFTFSWITRLWKASEKLETTTRESRGSSSTSPRVTTH